MGYDETQDGQMPSLPSESAFSREMSHFERAKFWEGEVRETRGSMKQNVSPAMCQTTGDLFGPKDFLDKSPWF